MDSTIGALCRTVSNESRRATPESIARVTRAAQQVLAICAASPASDRDAQLVVDACRAALRGYGTLIAVGPPLHASGLLVATAMLGLAGMHTACRRGHLHTHVAEAGSSKPVEAVSAVFTAILSCMSAWESLFCGPTSVPGAAASALALLAACDASVTRLPALTRRWAPRMAVFCFRAAESTPSCAGAAASVAGSLLCLLAWSNIENPRRGGGHGGAGGAAGATQQRTTAELHVYLLPLLGAADSVVRVLREVSAAGASARATPWEAAALHALHNADAVGHRVATDVRMAELASVSEPHVSGGSGGQDGASAPTLHAGAATAALSPASLARQLEFLLRVVEASLLRVAVGGCGPLAGPPGSHAATIPLAGTLHAAAVACDLRSLRDLRVPPDHQHALCTQGVKLAIAAVAAGGPHAQRFRQHALVLAGGLLQDSLLLAADGRGGGATPQPRLLAASLLAALAARCSLAALPPPLAAVSRQAVLACVGLVEAGAALPASADGLVEGALAALRALVLLQRQGALGDDVRYAIDRAVVLALRPPPAAMRQSGSESAALASASWFAPVASPTGQDLAFGVLAQPLLPRGPGAASAAVRTAQVSLLAACIDAPWSLGRRSPLLPALLDAARSLGISAWAGMGAALGGLGHAAPRLAELVDGIALARAPRAVAEGEEGGVEASAAGAPLAMGAPWAAPAAAAAAGGAVSAPAPAAAFGSASWPTATPLPDPDADLAASSVAAPPAAPTAAAAATSVRADAVAVVHGSSATACADGDDDDFPDIVT